MLYINHNIWVLPASNEVGMKVTGMFIFRYKKICTVKKININSFNFIQLFPEIFPDSRLQNSSEQPNKPSTTKHPLVVSSLWKLHLLLSS